MNKEEFNNNFNFKVVKIAPSKAMDKIYELEFFSKIDYVPLEPSTDNLIDEISQILFYKNKFYILDEIIKSIFCFDDKENLLFTINRVGQEPEEYLGPSAITIGTKNDYLLIHYNSSEQILTFNLDGEFVKSIKLDFLAVNFAYLSEIKYVFYSCFTSSNKKILNNGTSPNLKILDVFIKRLLAQNYV